MYSSIKKCFVFDFDCTITYSHLHWLTNEPFGRYRERWNNVIIEHGYDDRILGQIFDKKDIWWMSHDALTKIIFGNELRLNNIKNFFEELKKNNYDIYVSSRGNCDPIKKALDYVALMKNIFCTKRNILN